MDRQLLSDSFHAMGIAEGTIGKPPEATRKTIKKNGEAVTYATIIIGKTLYIAFQGSREISDWNANRKFWKIKFYDYGCKVHRGFRKQFTILDKALGKQIESMQEKGVNIVFCGFSLGGGLAQMFSYVYEETCVTGAAPRAGSPKFAAGLKRGCEHYRIEHLDDLVPIIPPAWFGYKHGTSEHIKLGKKKGWFRGTKNHSFANYRRLLGV